MMVHPVSCSAPRGDIWGFQVRLCLHVISKLRINDVDLDHKLLYVRKKLAYIKDGEAYVEEINRKRAFVRSTKTKASKRTIHLNDTLIECLLKQKEQQEKEKILYKDLYEDKG